MSNIHSPFSGEGDPGRNQLTYPDTAGECMETPQSEQQTQEIDRNEGKIEQREKQDKCD